MSSTFRVIFMLLVILIGGWITYATEPAQIPVEASPPPFRTYAILHHGWIVGYFIRNVEYDKCLFVTSGDGRHVIPLDKEFCYGF